MAALDGYNFDYSLINYMWSVVASIVGMVTGISALALSLFNYFRDSPKVIISIKRSEIKISEHPRKFQSVVVIVIDNLGRRPVYITRVGLQLPKSNIEADKCILIDESIKGQKIGESDPPLIFTLTEEVTKQFRENIDDSRAVAYDSTGKRYTSSRLLIEAEYEGMIDGSRREIFVDSEGFRWVTPERTKIINDR